MTNKCSKCGKQFINSYQYCPFCGQKTTKVPQNDSTLNLINHFIIVGFSREKSEIIQDKHIVYAIDEDDVFNINIKVTMPINEAVIFDVIFQDVNGDAVFNLKSSSSSLLSEENEIVKVPFSLPAGTLSSYNVAILKYNNEEVFRIDFVPSVISVKIDNHWFNMRMSWTSGYYYNSPIKFLTWWMLMPNTTHRDIRYMSYNIELREIKGWDNQEKSARVSQFISVLRSKSNVNISLATTDRSPASFPVNYYFNPDDIKTNIYVELSARDYIDAIKDKKLSLNRTYLYDFGLTDNNGETLTYEETEDNVAIMLQKRFDGCFY